MLGDAIASKKTRAYLASSHGAHTSPLSSVSSAPKEGARGSSDMADILEKENCRELKVTELKGRPDWQGMEHVTETGSPLDLHTWVFCLQRFHQFALGLSKLPGN